MGNKECKPPRPILRPDWTEKLMDLKSMASVSNPSLVTLSVVSEDALDVSLSQQFCIESMDNIYSKFVKETKVKNKITYNVTNTVVALIEAISSEDHILFVANKFMKMITQADDVFLTQFASCAERNVIRLSEHFQFNIDNRITLHIMHYLKLHRAILAALEDGKEDKAQEIINLIALSHLIMRVNPEYFKILTVKVIKSMLHFKLITEDQLPQFVYYNTTIINSICDAMERYKKAQMQKAINQIDYDNSSRENYRELKKWKTLVLNIRKMMMKQITMLEKQAEEVAKRTPLTEFNEEEEDTETWKIIRYLKKGFKYRNRLSRHTDLFETKREVK